MEESFFYNNNNYKLFGSLHQPNIVRTGYSEPPRHLNISTGIVLCAPFAEEKLWSHRVFVSFARLLVRKGYTILRFDYMGHGDSEGNFEDSSIKTRHSDIAQSVEILKTKAKVHQIGLVGLRLGATLAAISAEEIENLDFLVLWEPVVKVEDYLQQCLRSNLATQMAIYKKILRNRKQITQDLLKGKSANIDGYLISREFYKQASSIDLIRHDMLFSKPVQIVQISKNDNLPIKSDLKELYEKKYKHINHQSELSMVVEEPFWYETKTYYQEANNLFQKTFSWFDKNIIQD